MSINIYQCTWLHTVKDRVLRKTFGLEREDLREEWEKMANEVLHGLYSTDNEMGGKCGPYG
jgi:hypothetical protein